MIVVPASRNEKRAKFTAAAQSGKKRRKTWVAAITVLVILGVAAGGYLIFLQKDRNDTPGTSDSSSGDLASDAGPTEMADITAPVAADGKIILSLAEIKKNKLIWFAYGVDKTPVLAYTAPSGKVVTAISMCEPCRSDRFHIEGDELVCNACGTRWTLEDLKGISGGCPQYPPQQLENQISGDEVAVGERAVLDWKPRV